MGKIIIIACVNLVLTLGDKNDLLYKIKNDLRNFKSLTKKNTVLMGRKTYESLPIKPLPDRNNIMITHDIRNFEGCIVATSLQSGIKYWKDFLSDTDLYILGGGSIYKQSLDDNLVDEMFITLVHDKKDGDTKFPDEINSVKWEKVWESTLMYDETLNLNYQFIKYKKNIK